MPAKKKIQFSLDKEWEIMIASLHTFCDNGDKEALHDFRVTIKKIKAIAWLLDACNKNEDMRHCLIPITKIFKHAGSIRNAHVFLKYCQKNEPSFEKLTKQQQHFIQKEFIVFSSKKKLYARQILKTSEKMNALCKPVSYEEVKRAVLNRKLKILLYFLISNDPALLHDYRKKIKTLIYIDSDLAIPILKHARKWNKLQELIGIWHDSILFQENISKEYQPYEATYELQASLHKQMAAIKQTATKILKLYDAKKMF